VGLDIAIPVVLGLFGGSWLDKKYGTNPWLTVVGMVLGVAVGFNMLFRVARKLNYELERENDHADERRGHDDAGARQSERS